MTNKKSAVALRERRVFISDCEGPISKNDNAFELTSQFIPKGNGFFALISRYDDVLADIVKREGYKAGDTLRLILPFLKAYGVTNSKMKDFSSMNILLIPGADEMLRFVNGIMPSFIISTSYEHYIHSVCEVVGFPEENVYCTRLDIDRYELEADEVRTLKTLKEEMSEMSMIEIPRNAKSLSGFTPRDQATINRLDEIFWEIIPDMAAGRMLEEVNPVGGREKANSVQDVVDRLSTSLSNVMYVGDSITDVEPFQLVRENSGLTISFNGNQYAIREAEIAVLSNHAVITSILTDVFNRFGKGMVIDLVKDWNPALLKKCGNQRLFKKFVKLYSERTIRVEIITPDNIERLTEESVTFRKTVRGEAIGKLG